MELELASEHEQNAINILLESPLIAAKEFLNAAEIYERFGENARAAFCYKNYGKIKEVHKHLPDSRTGKDFISIKPIEIGDCVPLNIAVKSSDGNVLAEIEEYIQVVREEEVISKEPQTIVYTEKFEQTTAEKIVHGDYAEKSAVQAKESVVQRVKTEDKGD